MYIHVTDYKYRHIYNVATLNEYNRYCERDISRLEELIQKVQEYQKNLNEHLQHVLATSTKKVVFLSRSMNYGTKRKQFHVYVEDIPQIEHEIVEGNWVYGPRSEQKEFEGKDRHKAIQYANELAKKYDCEIQKNGFWR